MENDRTADRGARFARAFDRIEAIYLRLLRGAVLVLATILIVIATAWGAISVVKVLRSPDSVKEEASTVAPAEIVITDAQAPSAIPPADSRDKAGQRRFYEQANKRYHAIYRASFDRFKRADDKSVTADQFDDLMLNSRGRLAAIAGGTLDFDADQADVETFLKVVAEAGGNQSTVAALNRYKTARKQRVAVKVQRTRQEQRRGWDAYSSNCAYWYEAPVGCAVTRSVSIPYTETIYEMRYPEGVKSPSQLLKSYQDRYFELLAERRTAAADAAAEERRAIAEGQVTGWTGLGYAVGLLGSFIVLMFFFLLIAIERHQRGLASRLAPID